MALDADAEPLTRDDIDGIIAHGDPVERMFLLRRHDLTAGQWLRLLSDGSILLTSSLRLKPGDSLHSPDSKGTSGLS